jgi:hypothetical protein
MRDVQVHDVAHPAPDLAGGMFYGMSILRKVGL